MFGCFGEMLRLWKGPRPAPSSYSSPGESATPCWLGLLYPGVEAAPHPAAPAKRGWGRASPVRPRQESALKVADSGPPLTEPCSQRGPLGTSPVPPRHGQARLNPAAVGDVGKSGVNRQQQEGWVRTGHGECGAEPAARARPSEGEGALLGVAHAVQVGQAGVLDHARGSAHQHRGRRWSRIISSFRKPWL